ncbi:MAG TPA: hypothetical protein VNQ77_03010 [Frankiaceae bacterium]|nr:hypothetical protein [Frankiaceae bacterium]
MTCADFVTEDRVRRVALGERVTHAVMGVVYGAMLAHLVPILLDWHAAPTALSPSDPGVPYAVRAALTLLGIGTLLSGARDLYATTGRARLLVAVAGGGAACVTANGTGGRSSRRAGTTSRGVSSPWQGRSGCSSWRGCRRPTTRRSSPASAW